MTLNKWKLKTPKKKDIQVWTKQGGRGRTNAITLLKKKHEYVVDTKTSYNVFPDKHTALKYVKAYKKYI